MNAAEIVGYVVVPLFVFIVGVGIAGVRGVIRLTQYLAKGEDAADRVAESNEALSKTLSHYMERTDTKLGDLTQRVDHITWRLDGK